jgi:predicted outer membrane repeat protein
VPFNGCLGLLNRNLELYKMTNITASRRSCFISVLYGALAVVLSAAQAGVVTCSGDSGAGSLRQAIADAGDSDTISFNSTLSGQTIVLSSGQLLVNKHLTVDASALSGGITIDANNASRIFEFASGTTCILGRLTLTNGYSGNSNGGSIYLQDSADLTLNNCTLIRNSAGDFGEGGGIWSDYGATLRLNDSNLIENYAYDGGGICNYGDGTVILTNSILSGNFALARGGGIKNSGNGTVILNNSTLSMNSAGLYGGGIAESAGALTLDNSTLIENSASLDGGGIYISQTYLALRTLNNSTLSGNSAGRSGGGIYAKSGSLILNNCTLSGNSASSSGGGICNAYFGTLTLNNSIVAASTAPSDANIAGSFFGANNITSGDPLLASLGDYGGPTQTMPPLLGSPAIDAADVTALTTDQRGFSRMVNGAVDIGAVEFRGASDIALYWNTDWDSDGNPFGVEYTVGTDYLAADPSDPANLAVIFSGDNAGLMFGFNPEATNYAAWVVYRSLDLIDDPFVEIYRYDGPTGVTTTNEPLSINRTSSAIELLDLSGAPRACYLFKAETSP